MKKKQKERDLADPKMLSSREFRHIAKKATKLEPVCKYKCKVFIENSKGYELLATTKDRLLIQQDLHAQSYGNKKVTFSEIQSI